MSNYNNKPFLQIDFIGSTKNPLSNKEACFIASNLFRNLTPSTQDQLLVKFIKNNPTEVTSRSNYSRLEVTHTSNAKIMDVELQYNHNILTKAIIIVFNKDLFYYSINLSLDNIESLKLFIEEIVIQLHSSKYVIQDLLHPNLTPTLINRIKEHKTLGYIFYNYVKNNSSDVGEYRNILINEILSDFYSLLPDTYSESKAHVFEMEFINSNDGISDYDIIRNLLYNAKTTDAVLFFENDKTGFSIELNEFKDPVGILNMSFDITKLKYEKTDKSKGIETLLSLFGADVIISSDNSSMNSKAVVSELVGSDSIFEVNFKFDNNKRLIKVELSDKRQIERYFMFFWANRKFFKICKFVNVNKPRKKYNVPDVNILSFIESTKVKN